MFEHDGGHGYNRPQREAGYRWFTRWLEGAENTFKAGARSTATRRPFAQ
jgi:hypothetical protein